MAIHQALLSSVRLEAFPKATIDVYITVIETDGIEGCVAAGSIAASTALAHAGIEVFGLVVSCSAVCFVFMCFKVRLTNDRTGHDRDRGLVRSHRGGNENCQWDDCLFLHACSDERD